MMIGATIPTALATRMKSRLLTCLSVFMSVPSVWLINRNFHYPIPADPQYTPDRP
jgi:arginine decarboxylase-like protein